MHSLAYAWSLLHELRIHAANALIRLDNATATAAREAAGKQCERTAAQRGVPSARVRQAYAMLLFYIAKLGPGRCTMLPLIEAGPTNGNFLPPPNFTAKNFSKIKRNVNERIVNL